MPFSDNLVIAGLGRRRDRIAYLVDGEDWHFEFGEI